MRNGQTQSPRTTRTSAKTRRNDLADWRHLTRPIILDDVLNRTRDLCWSRELIDLLLDELHVSDEFDDRIGRVPASARTNYPQLVALALVLRHSWFPEDLARIIAELGLSPSPTSPAVERAPSPHTRTPQKGEARTC